ncbi:hypothetical protein E2C01_046593 [Portunus trituberculatus]|uniref:Uncharacterized protein n=1 Tax=Portunus trituberculatus TaxID=210409 RepID=A0A5B7G583_PORTR|nr:hypothetical protein [Portunus trituberculatus]
MDGITDKNLYSCLPQWACDGARKWYHKYSAYVWYRLTSLQSFLPAQDTLPKSLLERMTKVTPPIGLSWNGGDDKDNALQLATSLN